MAATALESNGLACYGGSNNRPNPCFLVEDYIWVDREGRPTSPPPFPKAEPHNFTEVPIRDRSHSVSVTPDRGDLRRVRMSQQFYPNFCNTQAQTDQGTMVPI